MTIAYLCLVLTIFIPLICAGYAKFSVKGYDNKNPREFLSKLEGEAKRANAAQLNAYEAFPPFAAGITVAHQLQVSQFIIDYLAVTFLSVRILYSIFYIKNLHILRSIVWFIGFFITITLFFIDKY